jgi:hypothetical protein
MKWLIAAAALALASGASAQDKTFTLTVTNQDLQVLSAGLDELPRKISEPLVEKLQRQLVPQMQPAPAAPAPSAPPATEHAPDKPAQNPHPSF